MTLVGDAASPASAPLPTDGRLIIPPACLHYEAGIEVVKADVSVFASARLTLPRGVEGVKEAPSPPSNSNRCL